MARIHSLGILRGHNSGACLARDGEVIALVSEERFNRIKNTNAFPFKSVEFCLQSAGLGINDLDFIVYSSNGIGKSDIADLGHNDVYACTQVNKYSPVAKLLQNPSLYGLSLKLNYSLLSRDLGLDGVRECVSKALGAPPDRILSNDHHTNHAYAAFYGFCPSTQEKTLVLTLDAEGDLSCSKVFVSKDGCLECIASTPGGRSIATFYGIITQLLGMKMNEHEYKIMGMAPYVSEYEKNKVLPVFAGLFSLNDDLTFNAKIEGYVPLYHHLREQLQLKRFDGICAAVQEACEDWSLSFVSKAVQKTGTGRVCLSGGFFMNVKANMKISGLDGVQALYPCPSCGDESLPIGAAFHGYFEACRRRGVRPEPKPLKNLYLGPEFGRDEIRAAMGEAGADSLCRVSEPADMPAEIASLLAAGEVVARFDGRMEFGARALGNRSILAHPSKTALIRLINDQIKCRDFWMPFACTVLKERAKDYLVNPKGIDGSFMIITFETTELARRELAAGLHPYDFTCRPQILSREQNPAYHELIRRFEQATGVGAVLNTSFNIHGEPIVCSPADALSVFKRSGLENLAIGPFLLRKRSP